MVYIGNILTWVKNQTKKCAIRIQYLEINLPKKAKDLYSKRPQIVKKFWERMELQLIMLPYFRLCYKATLIKTVL